MGGRWRGPGVTEVRVGVAAVRQGVVGAVRRFAGPRRAVVAGAAWRAWAGGLLLLLAAGAGPEEGAPPLAERTLPPVVEMAAVAASLAAVLAGVWYGLGVDEATRFASFAATVAFVASALAGLGVIGWLQGLYLRYRAVTLAASAGAAVALPLPPGRRAPWRR